MSSKQSSINEKSRHFLMKTAKDIFLHVKFNTKKLYRLTCLIRYKDTTLESFVVGVKEKKKDSTAQKDATVDLGIKKKYHRTVKDRFDFQVVTSDQLLCNSQGCTPTIFDEDSLMENDTERLFCDPGFAIE